MTMFYLFVLFALLLGVVTGYTPEEWEEITNSVNE